MAYITKLSDKHRKLPWRAQVRRKGHKVLVKMFESRREAEHWAAEQERNIRLKGTPLTIEALKKHTVGEIVERYLRKKTPTKGCAVSEAAVLKKFLKHQICSMSLAYASKQDAYDYIEERLKTTWNGHPIAPSTIRRELNSIQHIFEVAREEWGFSNLQNPFRGIRIKGSTRRRERRLREGELAALMKACEECRGLNEYYVPLAIRLAVETAMRLQEIFNLTWRDWNPEKQQIRIRKSKTDYRRSIPGRTIVATPMAELCINRLALQLSRAKRLQLDERIFPMTKGAFQQSWAEVKKRADSEDLTFHDLRHEAGSRFDEAGLTKGEHDLMMGHTGGDVRSIYVHADLKSIQQKLERHTLGGRTLEQIERDLLGKGLSKLASDPKAKTIVAQLNELPSGQTRDRLLKAGISDEELASLRELVARARNGYQLPLPYRSQFRE